MSTTDEKLISTLNHLIAICKDGQKGFQAAAQGLEVDAELAELCLRYADQRAQFAAQLQAEVKQLAGDPEYKGTLTGTLHRGWMNMKAVVTGGDEDVIIAECEAAEDETKEAYEKTLQLYMPVALTQLIQRQYKEVKDAHAHFSSLKKAIR